MLAEKKFVKEILCQTIHFLRKFPNFWEKIPIDLKGKKKKEFILEQTQTLNISLFSAPIRIPFVWVIKHSYSTWLNSWFWSCPYKNTYGKSALLDLHRKKSGVVRAGAETQIWLYYLSSVTNQNIWNAFLSTKVNKMARSSRQVTHCICRQRVPSINNPYW